MKSAASENSKPGIKLTKQNLQELKEKGYLYVLVKGYTTDRRIDYIEPNHIILIPVKGLSSDPTKKGIYEPIDSPILSQWAQFPDVGVQVLIEADQPLSKL